MWSLCRFIRLFGLEEVKLLTERLRLREFVPEDWKVLHRYKNDSRYQAYYEPTEWTETAVRRFVDTFVNEQTDKPRKRFHFAIEANGRLIGISGIRFDEGSEVQANMGYELCPDEWRKGYATEAANRILLFAFTELGLKRVWAASNGDNLASARVLEKVGFLRELCQRDHLYFKDRFWDRLVFGILRSDWEGNKEA